MLRFISSKVRILFELLIIQFYQPPTNAILNNGRMYFAFSISNMGGKLDRTKTTKQTNYRLMKLIDAESR